MCILGEPGQQLWCHQEALEEDPHLHVRLWRVCSCVLFCRIHALKSASGAYYARLKAPALQLKTPKIQTQASNSLASHPTIANAEASMNQAVNMIAQNRKQYVESAAGILVLEQIFEKALAAFAIGKKSFIYIDMYS